MTTDACEGPCNRAWRQARDAYTEALDAWDTTDPEERGDRPTPPELSPSPGEPVWCRRCTGSIRAALADLDNLAAMLAAEADGHRGQADAGDKIRATRSSPSPSPAADTLDELYGALTQVEADWREARSYGPRPARSRGASALTIVIAWLGRHLDDILAHPGSVLFGLGVLGWQRRLQTMTKSRPTARRKPVPCPRCDRRTLHHEPDRDLVRCENPDCARIMTNAEYEDYVSELGRP